jgi:CheY-like chemotaxis protein
MPSIRILLVDDNPQFLKSATGFLNQDPNLIVVGLAASGQEALEQVQRLTPDLVLMDIKMPGMSGFETTRQMKTGTGAPCVIMWSLHDSVEYRFVAEEAGADGFVAKPDIVAELRPLIYQLLDLTDCCP